MTWGFLVLWACSQPSAPPPQDTVATDLECLLSAVRVGSPRYGGAPIFFSDPYLTLDRTTEGSAFTRVDVNPPVALAYDMIDVPGGGHLIPSEPLPPGARLRLDEGYGCPVWEGDVHPAGLPVNPADLQGRTWVLQGTAGFDILTTLSEGAEFGGVYQFQPRFSDGQWPLYLHAEVEGDDVVWSLAGGVAAGDGFPNPCTLPIPVAAAAPFDPVHPSVLVRTPGDVTLGGPSLSFTLFRPSLRFTPAPEGTSIALVRVEATIDPRELLEVDQGQRWIGEAVADWCEANLLAAPLDQPLPPCLTCDTTPSGFCTDRALIILDAPAVDVPWPTEASIATNPACLTGG
jgi:hypothetical protein